MTLIMMCIILRVNPEYFIFLKRTYFWLILDLPEVYFGLTFTFFRDIQSPSPHSL